MAATEPIVVGEFSRSVSTRRTLAALGWCSTDCRACGTLGKRPDTRATWFAAGWQNQAATPSSVKTARVKPTGFAGKCSADVVLLTTTGKLTMFMVVRS